MSHWLKLRRVDCCVILPATVQLRNHINKAGIEPHAADAIYQGLVDGTHSLAESMHRVDDRKQWEESKHGVFGCPP